MWVKLLKKYLLIFLLGLAFVEAVNAAATKFTDVNCRNLTVTGTLTSGGCTCTNISTTTITANDVNVTYGVTSSTLTVSTMTVTGSQGLRLSQSPITITGAPAAANILGVSSTNVLYISTGTGAGAW